jgi:pimeloyl-ACP methyl ester carboxylesterase
MNRFSPSSTLRAAACALILSVPMGCSTPGGRDIAASAGVTGGIVRADDGVPIAYDVRGSGDTAVVFIHCWACSRALWQNQLDLFAARYRVVSLDLPGHGASGANRQHWSIAGLASDVEKVISTLGLKRVVLVGHSMGGPVALLVAGDLPGPVVGVACVDTLHDAAIAWSAENAEQLARNLDADFDGFMSGLLSQLFPEDADPAAIARVKREAASADKGALLGLLRDFPHFDLKDALARAKVPVRCVNSHPRPPMIPVTAISTNRQYADYDAVLLDGVGHYPMLERPRAFNERLGAMLRELSR